MPLFGEMLIVPGFYILFFKLSQLPQVRLESSLSYGLALLLGRACVTAPRPRVDVHFAQRAISALQVGVGTGGVAALGFSVHPSQSETFIPRAEWGGTNDGGCNTHYLG